MAYGARVLRRGIGDWIRGRELSVRIQIACVRHKVRNSHLASAVFME